MDFKIINESAFFIALFIFSINIKAAQIFINPCSTVISMPVTMYAREVSTVTYLQFLHQRQRMTSDQLSGMLSSTAFTQFLEWLERYFFTGRYRPYKTEKGRWIQAPNSMPESPRGLKRKMSWIGSTLAFDQNLFSRAVEEISMYDSGETLKAELQANGVTHSLKQVAKPSEQQLPSAWGRKVLTWLDEAVERHKDRPEPVTGQSNVSDISLSETILNNYDPALAPILVGTILGFWQSEKVTPAEKKIFFSALNYQYIQSNKRFDWRELAAICQTEQVAPFKGLERSLYRTVTTPRSPQEYLYERLRQVFELEELMAAADNKPEWFPSELLWQLNDYVIELVQPNTVEPSSVGGLGLYFNNDELFSHSLLPVLKYVFASKLFSEKSLYLFEYWIDQQIATAEIIAGISVSPKTSWKRAIAQSSGQSPFFMRQHSGKDPNEKLSCHQPRKAFKKATERIEEMQRRPSL